jgi:hypothetical protein
MKIIYFGVVHTSDVTVLAWASGGGLFPPSPWQAKAGQKKYIFRLFGENSNFFAVFRQKKIFPFPGKKAADAHEP